jgi:hypothetical protein
MSNTACTTTEYGDASISERTIELDAAIQLPSQRPPADDTCWQLLAAQVPLTLLVDLALPSRAELAGIYEELLNEPCSTDWVPT